MAGELDNNYIADRTRDLERHEALVTQYRAYGRELSVVCLLSCLLGVLALAVAYFGRFDLGLSTPGSATIVSSGTGLSVTQSRVEFTSLIVGFATACFAATLVVFGGCALVLRKMAPPTAWLICLAASISAACLLFLTFG